MNVLDIFVGFFVNAIFAFYYLVGNLGWSIVIVTVLIRLVMMPLVVPSLKSAKKMRELQPKLKKLQEKYKGNKEGLAKAQMDLYKEEGVNPLSGCLPQIAQIAVLLLFFSAFNTVVLFSEGKGKMETVNKHLFSNFKIDNNFKFDTGFMGSNITETPAKIFSATSSTGFSNWWMLVLPVILLVGSGALQYWSAKLMMPVTVKDKEGKTVVDPAAYVKATPEKSDDMMEAMRTQSMYMMPLMTILIGWNFSLGLLLYWFVNSAVMTGQQVVMDKMGKI